MLHNNGLYACENKIITPFCVILYFDDLKFFGKTRDYRSIGSIGQSEFTNICFS